MRFIRQTQPNRQMPDDKLGGCWMRGRGAGRNQGVRCFGPVSQERKEDSPNPLVGCPGAWLLDLGLVCFFCFEDRC
jgi:hypothetical protein